MTSELGRRIAVAVRGLVVLGGDRITVGVSIGLALASTAGETAAQLLHRADRAVYAAKRLGRNRVVTSDE